MTEITDAPATAGDDDRQQLLTPGRVSDSLGARLQALRQRHGLSQRELARRAEMTNSTLSMIEQGKVSPSVASLERILGAIPISLEAFFSDSGEAQSPVCRYQEFTRIGREGCETLLMPLTEASLGGTYLARQILVPGARVTADWLGRDGTLGAVVVQGEVTLSLDGVDYALSAGDGFQFSGKHPNRLTNTGTQDCVLVAVSLPE